MSPLAQNLTQDHVIITKLDQPNRYDFSMHCACGFQHHGFLNPDKSRGDEIEDMRASARTHLINRHGVPATDVDKFFEIAPFTHVGGVSHDILKTQIAIHKEKAKAATAEKPLIHVAAPSGVPTAIVAPNKEPSKATPPVTPTANPAVPAKPVQTGGVTK